MALKFTRHPGREYVKVICQICGGLFYQKDTVQITDKYNHQYGLTVCRKDADERNDQVLPNRHVDRPISNPGSLSPERADEFSVNEIDDRLPGAPRLPFAQVHPINDTIDLFWQGPEDTGSSGIIGYKIQRSDPQFAFYETIETTTSSNNTYYQDLSADVNTDYSYRIAAVNSYGTGPYSIEFFWPKQSSPYTDINYLIISQNGNILRNSDTLYEIRLNYTQLGIL